MDPSENARPKRKSDQELKAKIKNMSKEAIAAAVSKKKECNARAMMIVEQSLELRVEESWLLDNLKHINKSHFQDIIEERAIIKVCGYPLCVEDLTDVPNKMYKISTKENKVYDITDRKNYCSNACYKAGTYLKDQLYSSPLWLRDCEIPVEYKLLSSEKERIEGGAGAEIDLGNTKPVKLDNLLPDGKNLESLLTNNTLIQNYPSTHEKTTLESDNKKSETLPPCYEEVDELNTDVMLTENKQKSPQSVNNSNEENIKLDTSLQEKENNQDVNSNNKSCDPPNADEEQNACLLPLDMQSKRMRAIDQNIKNSVTVIRYVERNIEYWFTLETMIYLLGPEKTRENLKISGYTEHISPRKKDLSFDLKCQEIYRKLNIFELKDKEKQKPSKAVPHYDDLKNETNELRLQVKSFFRGDAKVTFADKDEIDNKSTDTKNDDAPVLPIIDHCAIMLTRRRIFVNKLKKVLPDMLNALDLSQFRLGGELQELVSTFNLSPTNFSMRTTEWRLVAIIIIKLLTIRNEVLNFVYSSELTQRRLITYLLTYHLDGGYLDRFTSYLMDIERVVSLLNVK